MDKVNCELYRFIVELKLRARFAHQCRRMDDNRPCSRSTSFTSTSVVKDVKGTGDPKGIIDAVGRRQSAWRHDYEERLFALFDVLSVMRSAGSNTRKDLHWYEGTWYPVFSSANLTCRRNGGVKPAICHKVLTLRRHLPVAGAHLHLFKTVLIETHSSLFGGKVLTDETSHDFFNVPKLHPTHRWKRLLPISVPVPS
jgi:hypothetical protein